jgi:GTP-binding protein EngB required for normal cell division
MTSVAPPPSPAPPAQDPGTAADFRHRLQTALRAALSEMQRFGEQSRSEQLKLETQRSRDTKPLVVVAGEVNTGKSSLVNALVRRPGLSPVDYDLATGTWIAFQHAKSDRAAVRLEGRERPKRIKLDEIAEWATASRNPGNEKGVECIEIGLGCEALRSMTLVDTPGVGGLDGGHTAMALQALRDADALLFTTAAKSKITKAELDFLEAAAERIDTVVIAMTAIDRLDYADWQRVENENRSMLVNRSERFAGCRIVGTSTTRARERSGLPELEQLLTGYVNERAGALRLANAARFADSSIRAIESRLTHRLIATTDNPAVATSLEREQVRLAELQRDKANWQRTLMSRITRINNDRATSITQGVNDIGLRYEALANQKNEAALEQLPTELRDELRALANRVAEDVATKIRDLVEEILGQVDPDAAFEELLSQLGSLSFSTDGELVAPLRRETTQLDRLTTLQRWSSGRSIGGYALTSLPIVAFGGVPLLVGGFAVAAAFAWRAQRGQQLVVQQADYRAWQNRQLIVIQTELNNNFANAMAELQPAVSDAIRDYLAQRENEVKGAIKEHEATRARDAETRKQARASIEADLARLRKILALTEPLIAELRGAYG